VLVGPPREVQEPAAIDRWSSPPPDSRRGVSLFSPRRERGTIPNVSASEAHLFVPGVSYRRNTRRLPALTTNKPLRGQHEVPEGEMTAHVLGVRRTESGLVFPTKEGAIGDVARI
jgi:hypothetical protein